MRRLGELLDSEHAMLRELATEPASVQAISQRTGQADFAVWHILARLEADGHVRGDRTRARTPWVSRIYDLTAAGRRAAGSPKPHDSSE